MSEEMAGKLIREFNYTITILDAHAKCLNGDEKNLKDIFQDMLNSINVGIKHGGMGSAYVKLLDENKQQVLKIASVFNIKLENNE